MYSIYVFISTVFIYLYVCIRIGCLFIYIVDISKKTKRSKPGQSKIIRKELHEFDLGTFQSQYLNIFLGEIAAEPC